MTDCNAKFTSADVTDRIVATASAEEGPNRTERLVFPLDKIPGGATVQRQGDRLVRVDLYVLECSDYAGYPRHHTGDGTTVWTDDTPGTTPHDDVTVSDAEVEAAIAITVPDGLHTEWEFEKMREALLAAKRAEKGQA